MRSLLVLGAAFWTFQLAAQNADQQTEASSAEHEKGLVEGETESSDLDAVDEELSYFLVDALDARTVLERGDAGEQLLGQQLWTSATGLAEAIQGADSDVVPKFLPIIANLRDGLQDEQFDRVALIESMSGLTAIQNSPGIFPGGKDPIDIEVRALRDGQEVNGLYVWIDLLCCVNEASSRNALPSVTSPSNASLIPGRYLVRLRDQEKTVAKREVLVGGGGTSERIDVVVP